MNSGMAKTPPKVVLDTNLFISALIFGGKPEKVYTLVLEKQIIGVTSQILIAELIEILIKKFEFEPSRIKQLQRITKKHFKIVYPDKIINVLRDEDDNRVLEAAIKGNCNFIVTGDSDLLTLKTFRKIKILTPENFLREFSS